MSEELSAVWLALAAQAEEQVLAVAAAYEAGRTTRKWFTESAALSVLAANTAATKYADVAVAAWRLAALGLPTPTLGLLPPPHEQDRLVRAFATVAAHLQGMSLPDRSARIARSEPLRAGRRNYQYALKQRGVTRWVRVVRPDACEECAALVGEVHDIDELLEDHDHPGCRCDIAPETPTGWGEQVKARQLQLKKVYTTTTGQSIRFSAGIRFQ